MLLFARAKLLCRGVQRSQTESELVIEYKSYRIEVCRVGKGWRASIYSPRSTTPLSSSPTNLEKSEPEDIVVEAKRIVDALLGPRPI